MCNRFIMVPQDVVDEIVREIEAGYALDALPDWRALNPVPDWPAQKQSAYPRSEVPVILPQEGRLGSQVMKWGYEVPWSKGVIFNTRCDTAMRPGSNMWAESLRSRRCIVPTFGFFEPHQSETLTDPRTGKERRQQYLFTLPGSPVLFIAGIYEGGSFSLMTTEPNASVMPVHDRMPLVLREGETGTWLNGDFPSLFDRGAIPLRAEKEVLQPSLF